MKHRIIIIILISIFLVCFIKTPGSPRWKTSRRCRIYMCTANVVQVELYRPTVYYSRVRKHKFRFIFQSFTVQHVHVNGFRLRVGWIALISAVVLDASLLYEQMTGGDRSFFGDHVHTSSGRIVTDYL